MIDAKMINGLRKSTSKRITGSDIASIRAKEQEEIKRSRALSDNLSTGSPARQSLNAQMETNKMRNINTLKETEVKQRDYTSVTKNRDYIDKSNKAGEKGDFLYRTFNDTIFDFGQFKDDNINKIDYIRNSTDYNNWDRLDPVKQAFTDRDTIEAIKNMSDSNAGIYNYLFNTEGKQSADEYLDNYIKQYNSNIATEQSNKATEFAKDHPVLGSLASSFATVAKPEGLLYTIGQNLKGEEVDPNSSYFSGSNIQNTLRGTVKQENNMGKVGGFLYDTGLSVLDSVLASAGGPTAGSLLLGGSAGSDAAREAKQKGATDKQAALSGLTSAIAEGLFERVSLGNLKSLKEVPISSIKDVALNTLKSVGVNASEEAATELSNIISDYFIMDDLSDYKSRYNNYIQSGYSEDDAKKASIKEMAVRIGMAAAGGALAGGGMAAVGQGINYASGTVEGAQSNKIGMTDAFIKQGLSSDVNSDFYKKASELQDKKPTNYQAGQITRLAEAGAPLQNRVDTTMYAKNTTTNSQKTQTGFADTQEINPTTMEVKAPKSVTEQIEAETNELFARSENYKTNGAKAFVSNYNEELDLDSYQKGFAAYYDAGMVGISSDKVQSAYGSLLSEGTRLNAYNSGLNDAKMSKVQPIVSGDRTYGVVESPSALKMDTDTLQALNELGKISKTEIRIEESIAGGLANGMYKNGVMSIALDSDNPYMTVAKHELTHSIQDSSPELYTKYKNFVISEINKSNPKTYNDMVDNMISRYTEMEQSITRDEAMDEIVADASEMFLSDKESIERLAKEDKNLAQKVIDIIRDIVDKIQKAITNVEPRTKAAKTLNENLDAVKKAEKLWVEALSDASANKPDTAQPKEQFSLKDSEGKNLSEAQQEFFKNSKVRDENGELQAVYHGTNNDFTVFDNAYSKEGNGVFWFSKNIDYAEEMANVRNGERIIEAYVNIENPMYAMLSSNEFSDPVKEKPLIEKAKIGGYDGLIVGSDTNNEYLKDTFYVAFKPEQIKSVENLNPTDNIDIRYQLKDIDYADYKRLYQENRKLRDINNLLNEQFKVTKELKPDRKQLTKTANEILKKAQSSYDVNSVVENLETIWKYVNEHSDAMYTEEAIEAVQSMSKMILKKSQATDNTLVENSKPMLEEIKKTPLVLSSKDRSDLASEGGFNNFRRKYFGKIKLVANDGIEVDTFYQGLSEKYPEFFDAEITHPADQLIKIAEVIDFIKPINYNPYGMSIDEASRDLANEIISSAYFDIGKAPATFADKKRAELSKLKSRYNQNVRELREEYKSKYNDRLKLIKQQNEEKIVDIVEKSKEATAEKKEAYRMQVQKLRDQNLQKLQAQQQRFSERMDNARERRNRTVEANKWKVQIKKVAKDLSDMIMHPTEKSHLPKGFTNSIKDVLLLLDFETGGPDAEPSKAALKWRNLKDAYAALKDFDDDNINSLYIENVESDLRDLSALAEGRRVNQLNHEELKAIYDIVKHIKHLVSMENEVFSDNIKASRRATAESVIHHLAKEGEFSQSNLSANSKGVNAFANMLTKGNIKPYYFFKRIGGDFEKLYKNVRDGEDQFVKNFETGNKYAHDMFKKYDYFSWVDDKPAEFVTEKGNKISITTEQKLYIYAAYRRNQGKQHILKGGVVVEDPKIETEGKGRNKVIKKVTYQSDPVQFSEKDMIKLEETLTEEQKGFVSDMVDYLSNDLSKLGNEVANKLFGIDSYTEENYIPLTSDRSYLNTRAGVTDDKRIKRMSFTKPTVRNASNPIIATGFMEVWSKHLVDMSMYNSLVVPLEDFHNIWNYKIKKPKTGEVISVKNSIRKAYGPEANKYIEKLIIDINGGIKQDIGGELSNLLLSKMKVDAVMGNLSVAIQQPSSLARAFVIIDPKYFVKTTFTKRDYEELLKYSPQAKLKQYGYFDVNMGRSLSDVVTEKEYDTPIDRIKAFFTDKNVRNEVFSWLPQKMDELTWSHIWNAVKAEVKDTTNLQEGSEEYWNHIRDRFKEVIDRSQVMDSVFQRSELMRSQNFAAKLATNFMAEPTVSYNMLYDAITQYKKDGKSAAPYVSRTVAAVISAMILNSLLKSIITAGRDKDEKKTNGEKYLDSFMKNLLDDPAGMIPYVNSIVSTFKGYEPIRPDMQLFQNLYYAETKLDSDKYTIQEKIQQLAQSIAPFFNVPLKNISKDMEMIWRNGKGLLENVGVLQGLSNYEKLQNKYTDIESSAASVKYYDMLYNAKQSGDSKLYQQIYNDLIKAGKKPSSINDAMASRKREGLIIRKKEEEYTNPALSELFEAYSKNDAKTYQTAKKKLLDEEYSADDIEWALNSLKKEKLKAEAPTPEEFIEAYKTGKESVWAPLYKKLKAAGWTQIDILELVK